MDLTTVVVTHRSRHAVVRLLDALGSAAGQVLAVDNASDDGTVELLRARGVRTLPLARNVGFAAAANRGAHAAEAGHLCFLNPDCEAGEELLADGLRAVEGRPGACAAPRLAERARLVEGRQPGYTRLKLLCDVLESGWGGPAVWGGLRRLPAHHDRSWFWAHGACLFVTRRTFLELGGFDARFFLYMEDVDFGRRLYAAGGRVDPLPGSVLHGGARGAAVSTRRHRALLDGGRIRYARIHHGAAFARLLSALAAPPRALRALRAGAA